MVTCFMYVFIVDEQDEDAAAKASKYPFWRVSSYSDIAALYNALDMGFLWFAAALVLALGRTVETVKFVIPLRVSGGLVARMDHVCVSYQISDIFQRI